MSYNVIIVFGVQVLARDPKTTVKILNACSTTRKSWRRMYSINYGNSYLINISKLEEEEVGKELAAIVLILVS
jgi:hypothetical protein